jgi:hypothetical protein
MPQEIRGVLNEYSRFGPVHGFPEFFTKYPNSSLALQYAEIAEIDVILACNHTQVYLKDYKPIQVDARIDISLLNLDDGASLDHFVCDGNPSFSLALQANSFASTSKVFMSFCPNVTVSRAILSLKISVRNETGNWIYFNAQSRHISISAFRDLSLAFLDSFNESSSTVAAGKDFLPAAKFSISSSICDRIQFHYVFQLSCLLAANRTSKQLVPFVSRSDFLSPVTFIRERVARSCVFTLSGCKAIYPGDCVIVASVPLFSAATSLSRNINVINGDPSQLQVVGYITERLNEGAIIWSSNATGVNCLSVSLADEFNNTVMQCQNNFILSASYTNASEYALYGPSLGLSDCNGGLRWCSTRVMQSSVIRLKISSQFFTKTLSSLIHVEGQGAATKILVLSTIPQTARSFSAGGTLPPVQIQVANAADMVLSQTSKIFVRIRLRPKNSTIRFSFYFACITEWNGLYILTYFSFQQHQLIPITFELHRTGFRCVLCILSRRW